MRVFIGYDPREELAYRVCAYSILSRASRPVEIYPVMLSRLRDQGLYCRPDDPLASTEFTYSRFLVPRLCGFAGWALFCDCDFLFCRDAAGLFDLADDRYAAMVVKHDHRPAESTKMDGCVQTVYPRKNWSSLVLWNCGHRANAHVGAELVNTASGAFLHRFEWLRDDEIGELPEWWNWLEGSSPTTLGGRMAIEMAERMVCGVSRIVTGNRKTRQPSRPIVSEIGAVHFTRGGPWFAGWQDVEFAELWLAERDAMLAQAA